MNENEIKLIPFAEANQDLLLNSITFLKILKERGIKIYKDSCNQECISEFDFKKLRYDNEIRKHSKNDLIAHLAGLAIQKVNGEDDHFKEQNQKRINKFRQSILILQNLHNKYRNKIDVINEESALVAAYMLFAKAINLLNMTCNCMEAGYLNAGVLFRIIDETVDLAEYFILSEKIEDGQENLRKWFYEDYAIPHRECRKFLSESLYNIIEEGQTEDYKKLMKTLYYLKSKMIHPTRNTILEQLTFSEDTGMSLPNSFDYAECKFNQKLTHVIDFFKSSFQAVLYSFIRCFKESIPLSPEDACTVEKLYSEYSKK